MTDDEDLDALRRSVRKLLDTSFPPEERRRLLDDDLGYSPSTWRLLAEDLGLAGLTIPEEYGGAGAGAAAEQVVLQEMGAALYGGPYLACVGIAVPALLAAADKEACAEHLPAIADGRRVATLAATEPGRGWALDDLATTARPGADGRWRLSGQKAYVQHLAAADVVLVTARTEHGVSLLAVDPRGEGVNVRETRALDLTRRLGALECHDAPAQLLSGRHDASRALERARDRSMVSVTAEQVGGATACLEMAVSYAQERRQFDRAIGEFQAIKHLCAEMLVDLESAAALAEGLARRCDVGEDLALPAAVAKAACSDAFFSVAARTIQVFGGIGFTWEHDAHLYYRRAKSSELLFGGGGEQRRRLGDLLGW